MGIYVVGSHYQLSYVPKLRSLIYFFFKTAFLNSLILYFGFFLSKNFNYTFFIFLPFIFLYISHFYSYVFLLILIVVCLLKYLVVVSSLVSLFTWRSPCWPGTHYVAKANLVLSSPPLPSLPLPSFPLLSFSLFPSFLLFEADGSLWGQGQPGHIVSSRSARATETQSHKQNKSNLWPGGIASG